MNISGVSSSDILQGYSQVFVVANNMNVASVSPPVEYAWYRLQSLLNYTQSSSLTLSEHVCTMPMQSLLSVLFRAVLGDFMTGNGALNQQTCRITADPATGYVTLQNDLSDINTVLIIIIIILFCMLGYLMKRYMIRDVNL